MLRTHCTGHTVVEHKPWSVLCLITHCVTILDMPLRLSLAIQGCVGNWENFPTRQSHNVICSKTSPVAAILLVSQCPGWSGLQLWKQEFACVADALNFLYRASCNAG